MQPGMGLHRYTGTAPIMPFSPWRGMAPPGHCRHCGQPSASCCCGCRECRKEAKELLVTPSATDGIIPPNPTVGSGSQDATATNLTNLLKLLYPDAALSGVAGGGTHFIGGGCCVTLAVEYAPSVATAAFAVAAVVRDSDGTVLIWGQLDQAGTGYRVHECIITTK